MTTQTRTRPAGNGTGSEDQVGAGSTPTLQPATVANADTPESVYRPSTVKRSRATNAMLDSLDESILTVLREEHPATLRGTFYRVVSAGAVEKSEAGYRQVGRQVLKLRRSGALPYSWITDGTRYVIRPQTWSDLDEMLEDAAASYRRMLWHSQPVQVQMFTEKDALVGVVSGITEQWDVPLGVLRGYASESFAWSVAESLPSHRTTIMYQLGDHDPSGVDAWRNFEEKIRGFAPNVNVRFERLAVLPWQIEQWHLLTRPTKGSDTRTRGFTGESVEVDAISPRVLRAIVQEAIEQHIDPDALALTRTVEAAERELFTSMIGGQS